MINIKLFQRGFIFYPSSNISILNKLPNYFITKNVNLKYSISFDKDYHVHINNDDKSFVIIIGIAIGGYWFWRKRALREDSSQMKQAFPNKDGLLI